MEGTENDSSAAAAYGMIYIGSLDGKVYAFLPDLLRPPRPQLDLPDRRPDRERLPGGGQRCPAPVAYPDPDAQRRLAGLVGVEVIKTDLIREAKTLLDPSALGRWSDQHYNRILPVVAEVADRTPLVVLAGDVGTGKTELAESFPDAVARDLGIQMTLYPLTEAGARSGR